MAWLRSVRNTKELIFATDSRLRFGGEWDCCPKLLELPRGDSAICFAGDTAYAYPVMIQIISYIKQYYPAKSRTLPLEELKGHLIRVLNNMTSLVKDLPICSDPTLDFSLIFGGYCWKRNDFLVWLIHYNHNIGKFTFRPTTRWKGGNEKKFYVSTGDYGEEVKERLITLLKKRGKLNKGGFDMEPLEILRDMLREKKHNAIGGAPQIIKVHKRLNCSSYGVFWPNKESQQISVLGRPLLDYEKTDYSILDVDTMNYERF